MNAQKLRERIALLTQQLEQLVSSTNATAGALAEVKHWLEEAEKEEAEKKVKSMAIVPA